MTSRDRILSRIRDRKPDRVAELPSIAGLFEEDSGVVERFASNLENSGAVVHRVDRPDLETVVQSLRASDGRSFFGDFPISKFESVGTVESERALDGASIFACSGVLGVAENGAIWVTELNCVHRAALFLPEAVALVVEENSIVPTMHEAYHRIQIDEEGFGIFVAGPSKTADIEQSLVIGAHGPRSLHVLIVS